MTSNANYEGGASVDSKMDEEYAQQRMQDAVKSATENYTQLMSQYGYLLDKTANGTNDIRKSIDLLKALCVFCFLLLPILSFWMLIISAILCVYFCTFKFQTYSLFEYISLLVGHCRIYLLQSENKDSIQWHILNRIIGFGQLIEFLIVSKKTRVVALMQRYKKLFSNWAGDTEAFPFLFSIVTTKYDIAYELIHKPNYVPTKQNDSNPVFRDREGKTVFMNEVGSFFPMIGIPAVLSIADGRHDIGREIVYIMLNVENKGEYSDFNDYFMRKYRKLPDNVNEWLKDFLGYPNLFENWHGVYFALTFYRIFGYQMTNTEIIYVNKNWPLIAACALPDWFLFLLFNNALPRSCFIAIDWLSNLIQTKCKDSTNVQNLFDYSNKLGFKDYNIVFYIASLSFYLMGGNLLVEDGYKRFMLNPTKEYYKFMNNKDLYVKETYRCHAAMVKAVSMLSHVSYTLRMQNKFFTFPARTIIAVSLVDINDSLPGYKADHHIVPRPPTDGPGTHDIYRDQLTFNIKDEYFNNANKKRKLLQSQRFCPGRVIIDPHLKEVFEIVFQSLKNTYKF